MQAIHKILIVNRGEIASRIMRTCRKMGIQTVVVYSTADADMPFVKEADEAFHVADLSPQQAYLDLDFYAGLPDDFNGIDAVHPGYGFLAENTAFARLCQQKGWIFIGPNPEAIDLMGSKSQAKQLMEEHGVPIIPGYQGEDQTIETLTKEAKRIGFPVLLKAAAGGGGKGMRRVDAADQLAEALSGAKREAQAAFGDDELILEKYFPAARHIEFQIFGDQHGHAIHLLERECSLQRRFQKIVEESPSPVLSETGRAAMGAAAVKAAKALQYDNAGTVEFLYTDTGDFYFLEVNTRLQVEHPVTEMITGLDLVQMQIESAEGHPLSLTQQSVQGSGYAVECRLYAEDPANDFLPCNGTIIKWDPPAVENVRIETAVQTGTEISIFYDPMIAKIIAWAPNRVTAHRKMKYFLQNLVCLGVTTNQGFLVKLFEDADFQTGKYTTHFIKEIFQPRVQLASSYTQTAISIAAIHDWHKRESSRTLLCQLPSGWRNNYASEQSHAYRLGSEEVKLTYRINGSSIETQIQPPEKTEEQDGSDEGHGMTFTDIEVSEGIVRVTQEKGNLRHRYQVERSGNLIFILPPDGIPIELEQLDRFPKKESEAQKGGYISPMPSQVVKIEVKPGQDVKEGEALIVLSSMKMENTLAADTDGIVGEVFVEAGQNIEAGTVLLTLNPIEEA